MAAKLAGKLAAMEMVDPEEFVASLPAPVRARVAALRTLQERYDEAHKAYLAEKRALELKYEAQYAPVFAERAEVVSGAKAVPEGGPEGIPGFWLTVLQRSEFIRETITEKDEEVLKFLQDIKAETLAGESLGFKLTFTFAANPFFSNQTLEKTYQLADDDDEPILEKSVGSDIAWAAGKNVTVKVMKKKAKPGKKAEGKPQTKIEPCDSFFNFFKPPKVPSEDEEFEEEEIEELQALIEQDYELGSFMRERLVPDALLWFTGEAEDDTGDFYFDGEDDEDEDGEDEEEDEPAPPPKGKKGKGGGGGGGAKGGAPAAAAGEQPQECKQQ